MIKLVFHGFICWRNWEKQKLERTRNKKLHAAVRKERPMQCDPNQAVFSGSNKKIYQGSRLFIVAAIFNLQSKIALRRLPCPKKPLRQNFARKKFIN